MITVVNDLLNLFLEKAIKIILEPSLKLGRLLIKFGIEKFRI